MVRIVRYGDKLKNHFNRFFTTNIETNCWEWCRTLAHGYGHYPHNYKTHRAHRFSWTLYKGNIPQGLYVLHKCDNRKCVNPDHLFLGTAKDNASDAMQKNRNVKNEKHGCSKLTDAQRQEIIKLFYLGQRRIDLAKQYNVHHRTIQNIVTKPEVIAKFGKRKKPRR